MSSKKGPGRFVAAHQTEAARRALIQPVPCWEYKWVIPPGMPSGSTLRLRQWVKTQKKQENPLLDHLSYYSDIRHHRSSQTMRMNHKLLWHHFQMNQNQIKVMKRKKMRRRKILLPSRLDWQRLYLRKPRCGACPVWIHQYLALLLHPQPKLHLSLSIWPTV